MHKKIQKAFIDIALQSPFLARACYSVQVGTGDFFPAMATDGVRLLYNPQWLEQADLSHVTGVLVHELFHVLSGHPLRRGGREPARWNVACDLAINPLVREAGYALPPGYLYAEEFLGLNAEAIYNRLPRATPGAGADFGQVLDSEGPPAAAQERWERLCAGMRWGNLPAWLDRSLQGALLPKPSLLAQLVHYLQQFAPGGRSFLRPSRRSPPDVLLPGMVRKRTGRLVLALDVSGSISEEVLREMWRLVLALPQFAELDVVCADAQVQLTACDVTSERALLELARETKGGGGTDFGPALAWAEKRAADAVVYLTDGDGSFPRRPRTPVVWVILGNPGAKCPWGEVLHHVPS